MKILHLAYSDASGVPSRWAAAHQQLGHQTRILFEVPHPFGYPADAQIRRWTPGTGSAAERADTVADTLGWADAVMAYDHPFYLDAALQTGKPVLFRALGSSARQLAGELAPLLESPRVVRATAGTADLAALLHIEQAGAPYPLLRPAAADTPVAVHAPSDRLHKQTNSVILAATRTGWNLQVIERAANQDVVAAKRRGRLVIDSGPGALPDGYGVNSVEAMAMGLPAVAGCSRRLRAAVAATGAPVVLVSSQRELEDALTDLHNPGYRHELGDAGRDFVAAFHSPGVRAREDIAAIQQMPVAA